MHDIVKNLNSKFQVYWNISPQRYDIPIEYTPMGRPKVTLSYYQTLPKPKDFPLCLKIVTTENIDRTKEKEELYVGFLSGDLYRVFVIGNLITESELILKGKIQKSKNLPIENEPIVDIEIDCRGRLYYALEMGELYVVELESVSGAKVSQGVDG